MSVTIYHNPRCSKSRQTLALLEENGVTPDIILYLENPPSTATLEALIKALKLSSARDMMRTKETTYKELSLADASEDALIDAMSEHPILMERPIVVNGDKAAIGRPPENVLAVI